MHPSEQAWASKALTMLSVALLLVYIVLWAVQWDELSQPDAAVAFLPQELLDVGDEPSIELTDRPANSVGRTFFSVQDLFGEDAPLASDDLVLPGTRQFGSAIAALELMGMSSPSPVLADERGILYTFLGNEPQALANSVLRLWWNIVEIGDKNDIHYHHLLGEKVQFVNLPMYAQKQVLLVVTFQKGHTWFIQVPYSAWYSAKPLLQQRFESLYHR